ncbi:hypothetical protein B296_00007448 [Ensete ventricosum]|uniref:beta-galactosidase n=1 Tax=Ensete ventricosum TaxID=4639 RepID=A0A427B319_ENSVE|nr:hypothetical protein B296_00007448 [Ensete ventricosum]
MGSCFGIVYIAYRCHQCHSNAVFSNILQRVALLAQGAPLGKVVDLFMQSHMERFTKMIVQKMKDEKLFAPQGGPIILAQVQLTQDLHFLLFAVASSFTSLSFILTRESEFGFSLCYKTLSDHFRYRVFGDPPSQRSAEDLAYSVARFFSKNGTLTNYYMYHGGTNFGRTGAAFVMTRYYDEAPLDEYGQIPGTLIPELSALMIISGTQQGNCNPKPQEAGDGLGVTKLSIPKSFDWISYLKDHSDYFKHLNPMSDIANRYFDAPSGNDPVALNLSSMGKGQVWINGESIGRFWVSYLSPLGKASQSM